MNKCRIITLLLIVLTACGEDHALREKTLYFNELHKGWVLTDSLAIPFVMVDDNGIAQSFTMSTSTCYFNKSWGSFLGINTDMTHTEYCYTSYSSTYGTGFSLSLTAGSPPGRGDEVFVLTEDIGFAYDLDAETLIRIDSPFGYKSKTLTSLGYEENETMLSTAEMLDSLVVNGKLYPSVLHFTFNDFKDQWKKYTLAEIFVAKGFGLIRYVTNSGLASDRKY